jgi:hypothetical protein
MYPDRIRENRLFSLVNNRLYVLHEAVVYFSVGPTELFDTFSFPDALTFRQA